ncbi:anti-sigma factor antagonist [Sphaerisporangium siamense]|uniref:Anti-sigma factor antagonist n=2 Tax=Sphaerisporangium TaxID=321315 RepID=A0A7W8Z3T5_9ACTN|nr:MULTISPECIES: STAS domain-containing protein [Sphaerisporangium]MBB4700336.1 anti-anti-sigma factor [Sphaerisporangium siamense]MBB5626926.1 anti-anti-sigma factor [Sphaerisporangium krabiense]GII66726.1 anti-sigma factor antagonist [Sphaerisporangium krabiense]GII87752.1 anti-sigma factor antagonist [Sphaerisporangium siamense]
MQLRTELRDDVTIIALEGSLDSRTAPQVQQEIEALFPDHGLVLLDLSGTSYMSSAGLRVLLLVYRRAQAGTARLALTGVPDEVREIMAATGFLDFFTVAGSVEDGVKALTV